MILSENPPTFYMRLTKRVNWQADVPVLVNHCRAVELQVVGRAVQS